MVDKDGSENPFLRLFMKQLYLNWVVLSSSLSHLFMVGKGTKEQAQGLPLRGPEAVEPSIAAVHKANTEANMAMLGLRPAPEEKGAETRAAIYLADADRVEKLLDIITNTVNHPNVPCIRAAAQNELAQIEKDLFAQMYPEQVAAEEAKLKEAEEARKAREEEKAAEAAKAKEPEHA